MHVACVYYRRSDHAGLGRRLAALAIDAAVLVGVLLITNSVLDRVNAGLDRQALARVKQPFVLGWLMLFVLYHVGLRRTHGGTLGYRAAGIRLESIHGGPPPISAIVKRFVLSILGPAALTALLVAAMLNRPATSTRPVPPGGGMLAAGIAFLSFLAALALFSFWPVAWEARRRALHDKFSACWMVRRDAVPIGAAAPALKPLMLGPFMLPYWDVEPLEASTAARRDAG